MSVPTIKVYLLTVVLPDITKKLWNNNSNEKHTYYIARAGTQWRGLNLQAIKCFPIQGYEIFTINTTANLDEPVPVSNDVLKGYLEGKDTLAAVREKLENYLSRSSSKLTNTAKKVVELEKTNPDHEMSYADSYKSDEDTNTESNKAQNILDTTKQELSSISRKKTTPNTSKKVKGNKL